MSDYDRIETAIRYIQEHAREQPQLAEVAAAAGLSEFHFQRLFTRWAGTSPKRFLQHLTADHARRLLEESRSVLQATYAAGLSGPGRLHDLMIAVEAATPGELKSRGAGLRVGYGVHETPFGNALIAATPRGVCEVAFLDGSDASDAVAAVNERWANADVAEDPARTESIARRMFEATRVGADDPIRLHLSGTNFQLQVWRALLAIPSGRVLAYRDIARAIGAPTASRAVGSAIAANPIAYLIPCHRVIRGEGTFGEYRWGGVRKRAILGWEAARA